MPIILLYLSPLSKQGLIHSLDFNHFNPQNQETVKWNKNIPTHPWCELSLRMINI